MMKSTKSLAIELLLKAEAFTNKQGWPFHIGDFSIPVKDNEGNNFVFTFGEYGMNEYHSLYFLCNSDLFGDIQFDFEITGYLSEDDNKFCRDIADIEPQFRRAIELAIASNNFVVKSAKQIEKEAREAKKYLNKFVHERNRQYNEQEKARRQEQKGSEVVASVPTRKHKKDRINKKWLKREEEKRREQESGNE